MSKPMCATCRFWERQPHPADGRAVEHATGECRKNSPEPMTVAFPVQSVKPHWPLTLDVEWCGEYEEKEEGRREAHRASLEKLLAIAQAGDVIPGRPPGMTEAEAVEIKAAAGEFDAACAPAPFDGTYPVPAERTAVLSREGKAAGE